MPEGQKKHKPKGRVCAREKCGTWYRPNRYRSAGPMLEFCSLRCLKKSMAESIVQKEIKRDW